MIANSTTFLLSTGNTPGCPRQIGHILELGGLPNFVEQLQNNFVLVNNCAWISNPITVSNFVILIRD